MIRGNTKQFEDFQCLLPYSSDAMLDSVSKIIAPMKLAASFTSNHKMALVVEQIDTFVTGL